MGATVWDLKQCFTVSRRISNVWAVLIASEGGLIYSPKWCLYVCASHYSGWLKQLVKILNYESAESGILWLYARVICANVFVIFVMISLPEYVDCKHKLIMHNHSWTLLGYDILSPGGTKHQPSMSGTTKQNVFPQFRPARRPAKRITVFQDGFFLVRSFISWRCFVYLSTSHFVSSTSGRGQKSHTQT